MGDKIRSDNDFESVYNPEDTMQSCEVSFFHGFRYEGDDHQEASRDESRQIRTRIPNSRVFSHISATRLLLKPRDYSIVTDHDRTLSVFHPNDNILDGINQTCTSDLRSAIIENLPEPSNILSGIDKPDYLSPNSKILNMIRGRKNEEIVQIVRNSVAENILDVNFQQRLSIILKSILQKFGDYSNLLLILRDVFGVSMVMASCENGNIDLIQLLIEELKADPLALDAKKRTCIHYACLGKNSEALTYLLSRRSDLINAQDNNGCSPLFYAVEKNDISSVKVLISHKATLEIANNKGLTPLDIASDLLIQKLILDQIGLEYQDAVEQLALRTCIQKGENNLLRNSRKDRVEQILNKVKRSKINQLQYFPLKNEGINRRRLYLNSCFKKRVEEIKLKIHHLTIQEQEYKIYNQKMKSLNQPIQVKRKVTLDDFVFFRTIGSGNFGEVHLVKIKEGILKGSANATQNLLDELIGVKDIQTRQIITATLNQQKIDANETDCIDDPSKKFYALKMIRKEAITKQRIIDYIETEKEVMLKIQHPFIAKLHLTFQNETHLFILMDFFQGGDLGRILEQEIEVLEGQVKIWAAQIVLALEELHNNNIVYRDLKPENVVLDTKGNLHLIDFGLSKTGTDELTSSFCGTPLYLPPEIINKTGHNKMVDWYSLGVIIYELLIGRPPYFSSDCKQLFVDIQTQPLRLPKSLPEESKNILIGLLKKNYTARLGFNKGAAEIKQHPWFKEINWEDVYAKQYECMKPTLLSIPQKPIKLKLNSKCKGQQILFKSKWSYYNIEDELAPIKTI